MKGRSHSVENINDIKDINVYLSILSTDAFVLLQTIQYTSAYIDDAEYCLGHKSFYLIHKMTGLTLPQRANRRDSSEAGRGTLFPAFQELCDVGILIKELTQSKNYYEFKYIINVTELTFLDNFLWRIDHAQYSKFREYVQKHKKPVSSLFPDMTLTEIVNTINKTDND